MNISPGSIVLLSCDPRIGHEIKKIRPAVVVQNKIACKYSPLMTVVPCSSRSYRGKIYEVALPASTRNGLLHDSVALVNQIMTFDKRRVRKVLGKLEQKVLQKIYQKLLLHLTLENYEL